MNATSDKITVISATGLVAIGAALIALALGGCGSKETTKPADEPAVAAKDTPRLPVRRERPNLGEGAERRADGADRPRRERPRLDGEKWNSPDMAARRDEMMQRRAEMVEKFDKNGDGELDETERAEMRTARLSETFTKLDSDGDGKISRDEAEGSEDGGRGLRRFDRIDADGDGFVSTEEMQNIRMGGPRGMRGGGPRGRRDRGGADTTDDTDDTDAPE